MKHIKDEPFIFSRKGYFFCLVNKVFKLKKNHFVLFFLIQQTDELDCSSFTFEQFYQLYLKVCGRLEIEQLCIRW